MSVVGARAAPWAGPGAVVALGVVALCGVGAARAAAPRAGRAGQGVAGTPTPGRTRVGPRPGMFGLLGPVRFGMSRAEARAASPALFDPLRTRVEPIMYGLTFDARRGLEEATMHFIAPQAGTLSALRQRWGAGQVCTSDLKILQGQTWHVWFTEDRTLRVALRARGGRARAVRFTPVQPVDAFLGRPGARTLGFERPLPLLGASLAALRRAYGARLTEGSGRTAASPARPTALDLDAVGLGPRVRVLLYFQDARGWPTARPAPEDTVRGFRFALDYAACKAARGEFLAALHRRFGVFPPLLPRADAAAPSGADEAGEVEVLQAHPRVVAVDDGRRLRLAVTPAAGGPSAVQGPARSR